MAAEFCVLCGRSDRPLTDGLCVDCFAKHHALIEVAEKPVVVLCPTCGARKIGQHWERRGSSTLLGADDLTPLLRPHPEVGIRKIRWTETGLNPLLREIEGEFDVRFRGTERTTSVRFQARIQHQTCPECSRKSGHYYTAVLQLRGPEMRSRQNLRALRTHLAEAWDALVAEARSDWRNALSWREERPEGWDVYLTDTLAARSLARLAKTRLGARVKESATLAGRKDGQDLYRVTFSVRIPDDAKLPARRSGARKASTVDAASPVER